MERRTFLKLGLSFLGLPLVKPKRRLIIIWLGGGHSNIDTFDPKPNAPDTIRGDSRAIQTSVPGLLFSDNFPKLAIIAHKMALFRTIQVKNGDHYNASFEMLRPNREKPTLADRVGRSALLPYAILEVPNKYPYIEQAHGGDWIKIERVDGRYVPPCLTSPESTTAKRELLLNLERSIVGTDRYSGQRNAAFDLMLGGGPLKRCFDLPEAQVKEFGGSVESEAMLLANRLSDAGVGVVTVICEQNGGWDCHMDICAKYKPMCASMDSALFALLKHVSQDVVVFVCSEFGRTPKINGWSGRDHWPESNTAILYSKDINPCVIGRTDNVLMVKDRPVSAESLCNTVLAICGAIEPDNTVVQGLF